METKTFILKANQIHGNKYDYSDVVYVNSKFGVEIICPEHGIFTQTPSNHLQGRGCKLCSDSRKLLTTNDFIEKARRIHGNMYDYTNSQYVNSHHKISIMCNRHGLFLQTANDHLSGYGCSACSNNKKMTTENFVSKAISIHGSIYDYSRVSYKNNLTKIDILCKKHGLFRQTPTCHTHLKQGCPKCRLPIGEQTIMRWLTNRNIEYVHEKSFSDCVNPLTNKRLKFDFFVPSKNLLIEYDGAQHFYAGRVMAGQHTTTEQDLKDIQFRDGLKNEYSKNKNITLCRIPYTEQESIPIILENII
jgi:hypothetical protein